MTIRETRKKGYFIAYQKSERQTIVSINKNKFEACSKCFLNVCKVFNQQ